MSRTAPLPTIQKYPFFITFTLTTAQTTRSYRANQ